MSGSNASPFTPLAVGVSDTGDFSSWLGRPVQIEDETYTVVQCGPAITAGGNGKQLVTAVSSGQPSWVVSVATGVADYLNCAVIPWTHTAAIASGAYFLALRDSARHVMLIRGALTGTMLAGEPLITGSGADLLNVFTGASGGAMTGVASTSSGIALQLSQVSRSAGVCLTADTGIVAVSGWVRYRAPFRGAD